MSISFNARVIALVAATSSLAGCNAVLGIREPVENNLLWDAGVVEENKAESAAVSTTPGPKTGTAGQGSTTGESSIPSTPLPASDDPRWAQWRIPSPKSAGLATPQSYRLDDNDLITDEVTQLQWQGSVDERVYTWSSASDYCGSFSLPGGPFRLPTRIELLSLVDFSTAFPTINAEAFPDTPPTFFWSSSTYVADPKSVWVVNFGPGPGFVSSSDQSNKYRVRCVRQTVLR